MKNIKYISSVLLLITLSCSSQKKEKGPAVPSFWAYHYKTGTDLHYGDDPDQRLDVYSQGQWIGNPLLTDGISKLYSPVERVTNLAPAIIIIHGQNDSIVPYQQAVNFHKLLDEAGLKNELVSIPGGKHLGFTEVQFQESYTILINSQK